MIYDIVDFLAKPVMWLAFSKEGKEWMPVILFALGVLNTAFLVYTFVPRRPR